MIYHSYIERCECMLKSVGQYILGCNNGQHIKIKSFELLEISEIKEISYCVMSEIWWNENKINFDNIFAYNVVFNEIHDNDNDNEE